MGNSNWGLAGLSNDIVSNLESSKWEGISNLYSAASFEYNELGCLRWRTYFNKLGISPVKPPKQEGNSIPHRIAVAECLVHWPLMLEVPGTILAVGEEKFGVQIRFFSCHLQK